jgi:hypothetical protein
MAEKPKFTRNDVSRIREGLLAEQAGFKPLKNFGVDFTLRPSTVFGALPFVGGFANIGQAIGKYQLEDSANKFFGNNKGFQDISQGTAGGKNSATSQLMNDIKAFKVDNPYSTTKNITRDDIQDFMMSKRPDLDLAPIQNRAYTQNELNELNDRTGGFTQSYSTQPFSSGSFAKYGDDYKKSLDNMQQRYNEDEEFKSSMGSYAMRDMQSRYDDNLKTPDQFAEDKVSQSNITNSVDPKTGKSNYDPAFARAVTKENQEASGSDTPSSTFICTALYEMKQMPISIYKYDQRYGQSVNRKIYNGYAIWGKPIANKMRNKGCVYEMVKPLALKWAEQMAYDMSDGKVGKKRYSIKAMKFLGEAICYGIGLFIKPEGEDNGRNTNRQYGKERRTVRGEDGLLKKRRRSRT